MGVAALAGAVGVVLATVLAATGGGAALVPGSQKAFPGWLAGPLPSPGWHLTASGAGLLLLALTVCWAALVWSGSALPPRATIGAIVAANLIVFLGPPLLSADVFGYIGFARTATLHGANPYVHGLADVSPDAIRPYVRWRNQTSPYGPLFTLSSYALVPLGVAGALWAFKLVALAASLALTAITWRLAERRGIPPAAAAAFVALNPLTILYAVGGAHNDLLVTAIAVGGLGLVTVEGRPRAGAAALVAATLTKASSGLLLPFALIAARPRRDALAAAAVVAVAGLVVALAVFGTPAITDTFSAQLRLTATHSVPNEVGRLLGLGGTTAGIRAAAAVVLVAALALTLRSAWRGADPFAAAGWATLAVLVTTSWLVPWYGLWLLPLAALTDDRRLRLAAVALTAAIVASHVPALGG